MTESGVDLSRASPDLVPVVSHLLHVDPLSVLMEVPCQVDSLYHWINFLEHSFLAVCFGSSCLPFPHSVHIYGSLNILDGRLCSILLNQHFIDCHSGEQGKWSESEMFLGLHWNLCYCVVFQRNPRHADPLSCRFHHFCHCWTSAWAQVSGYFSSNCKSWIWAQKDGLPTWWSLKVFKINGRM